jgi:hypothetical protein
VNLPLHPKTLEDTLKEDYPPLDAKTWHFIVYHILFITKGRGSDSKGCSIVTAHDCGESLWNHVQRKTGISVPSATCQSVMAYVEMLWMYLAVGLRVALSVLGLLSLLFRYCIPDE